MDKLPPPRLSRKSYIKHNQDVTRQIILPLALVTVIIAAAAVLILSATLSGQGDVTKWAQVATIWMIIPLMGLMLVILVASAGVVFLLARLLNVAPHYTGIAQQYGLWFNDQIILWVDRIMQPILKLKAWLGMFSKEQ
jgi:hypothetical protein